MAIRSERWRGSWDGGPSTVSREVARNTTRGRPYWACTAQRHADLRAYHRRRPRKLLDPWLWQYVQRHLVAGGSPEQIAGRLRRLYPDDMRKRLSAETIYAGLDVLPRGALRTELLAALRQTRKTRRPRARGTARGGQIPNLTPIAARPTEVATRTVPGHWEGDLLKGARNGSAGGTLVERTPRLVLLARMEGIDAASASRGFSKKLRHVPAALRHTLTYARGCQRRCYTSSKHRTEKSTEHRVTMSLHRSSRGRRDGCCEGRT